MATAKVTMQAKAARQAPRRSYPIFDICLFFISVGQGGRDQLLRVWMYRRIEHLRDRPGFENRAVFHDDHPMRHRANDFDIMGDEQITQPSFALKSLQKTQDLFLDRDVQRTRRFV